MVSKDQATSCATEPMPLPRLARRYARTHGPFTTREVSDRYGLDFGPVLRELERGGQLVRAELRPGGSEREWCDAEVLRRLRRASLASLRKELATANSGTKSKLKAQIKALSAELKTAEANAKKLAKDLAAEEAKLKQLTAEAEKTRTVSTAVVQQSKL